MEVLNHQNLYLFVFLFTLFYYQHLFSSVYSHKPLNKFISFPFFVFIINCPNCEGFKISLISSNSISTFLKIFPILYFYLFNPFTSSINVFLFSKIPTCKFLTCAYFYLKFSDPINKGHLIFAVSISEKYYLKMF